MERYDIDLDYEWIDTGIGGHLETKIAFLPRKQGDWVKYEDVDDLETRLGWAEKRIEELEEELDDERLLNKRLEAELTDYENPV